MDSFMRLMLYSNEMDIAGLILSSSTYHYAGGTMKDGTVVKPYRWTGTKWASEVLDNYAKVYQIFVQMQKDIQNQITLRAF